MKSSQAFHPRTVGFSLNRLKQNSERDALRASRGQYSRLRHPLELFTWRQAAEWLFPDLAVLFCTCSSVAASCDANGHVLHGSAAVLQSSGWTSEFGLAEGEALLWEPRQTCAEQNVPPCNFTARQIPHLQNLDVPNRINRRSHRCCFSKGPKLQQMPAKGSSHKALLSLSFFFSFFLFSRVCSHPGAVCQSPSEYTLHRLEHLEVRSSLIII